MHTKAFLFQHITIPPLLGSALALEGVGEVPTRPPDKQTGLLLYKHCSSHTFSFSRWQDAEGALAVLTLTQGCWCCPPRARWDSQMRRAANTINHHAPVKSLPLLRAVSSCCEKTSTISNQCPEGHQTRLKYTKTKQGGIMAWAIFINTVDPATATYPTRFMSTAVRF